MWDRGSKKGPNAYFFKFEVLKLFDALKRHLHVCALRLLSYATEISLSIMEVQWPEFLITRKF